MCPSVPSFPGARQEAERPPGRREYESFDSYEHTDFVVPAGTGFVVAMTFSGLPDRIRVRTTNNGYIVRLTNPGETPQNPVAVFISELSVFPTPARIVECRDPGGAGGGTISVTGYYATRNIDRRVSRRGPLASDVRARDQGAPEQISPR
jgi:hypothetical protein